MTNCDDMLTFFTVVTVQQRDDLVVGVYVTESRAYLPLCYDGFLQNWDADVCATLGKG